MVRACQPDKSTMRTVASSAAAAAVAALLATARAQQPEQAHLAYTGKAGQLSLDFMAHGENCSLAWGVQIATSPDFSQADFVPAYACDDFTAQESARTLAVRALLTGLEIGTQYYYVCGSDDERAPWSQVYSFTFQQGAARAGGAPVYAVLADFGFYNAESLERLPAEACEGKFDTLLHAGDFSYDFDTDAGRVGDGYMRQLAPVISSVPYMGIPGNHESATNYTHYKMRFASVAENAGANSGSGTNMFYSFNDGLTHFVMWDSEAYWSQPKDSQTAMENWLRADLAAANADRAAHPWVIARECPRRAQPRASAPDRPLTHTPLKLLPTRCPLASKVAHKGWWMDDTLQCPSGAGCVVWQILTEGGVDLFWTGHIHYYSRDLPQYPNAANGTGAVDTTCASANLGNATNPRAIYTDCKFMTTIVCAAPGDQEVNAERHEHPAPQLVGPLLAPQAGVTSTNNYGFSKMQAVNATHLYCRFDTAVPHVNSSAPHYTDELWLIVHNHGPRSNLPPV